MRAIGRIFAAIIGFMAAVLAFTLFLMAAKVGLEPSAPETAPWYWGQFVIYGGMAASMIGASAFVPAGIVILVTEIFSIRSFILHVGLGGLFGFAAGGGIGRFADRFAEPDPSMGADLVVLAAAGFTAGFVYWLLAGRMAGLAGPRAVTEPPSRSGA